MLPEWSKLVTVGTIVFTVPFTLAADRWKDTGGGRWSGSSVEDGFAAQEWKRAGNLPSFESLRRDSAGQNQWSPTAAIGHDATRPVGWDQESNNGHGNFQPPLPPSWATTLAPQQPQSPSYGHKGRHGASSWAATKRADAGSVYDRDQHHHHDDDHHHEEQRKPYSFSYSAQGPDGGSDREEKTDENGRVTGWYTITNADGRKRKVTYVADENGFRAKVETNEQGTANEDPASVHVHSHAPKVLYPVPASAHNQKSWDSKRSTQGWSPVASSGEGWNVGQQQQQQFNQFQQQHQQQQPDQPQLVWNNLGDTSDGYGHETAHRGGGGGVGGPSSRRRRQHQPHSHDTGRTGHGPRWTIVRGPQKAGGWSNQRAVQPPPVKASAHWTSPDHESWSTSAGWPNEIPVTSHNVDTPRWVDNNPSLNNKNNNNNQNW